MTIRCLTPDEAALVAGLYQNAPDYLLLADGQLDPDRKAAEFFTDTPPGCDPAASHRLGLFIGDRLSGVAEVSFGFPNPTDAYLGLMLLGPWARGNGNGPHFLAHVEAAARTAGAPNLYLAVLDANPSGRAFWQRMGFQPTGLRGYDPDLDHWLERMVKPMNGAP
jgi:GNAT superfamily N-acetyltransferase